MADSPDWTYWDIPTIIIEDTPTPETSQNETPVVTLAEYEGTSETYQIVAQWIVSAGKCGILKEISMASNNYAKTLFQLSIGTVFYFDEQTLKQPLSLVFPDLKLPAATWVYLAVRSSDGSSILVDGSITGKEVG